MKTLLSTSLVLIVLVHIFSSVSAVCTDAAINNCSTASINSHLPGNATELDNYCSQLPSVGTCLQLLGCVDADTQYPRYLEAIGQFNASSYLCNSTLVRNVYLKNQQCFANALNDSQQQQVCNMSAPSTANNSSSAMCTLEMSKLICLANWTQSTCGRETAHMFANYQVKRSQWTLLNSLNCSLAVPCSPAAVNACMSLQPPLSASETNPWTDSDFNTYCSRAENFTSCVNQLPCTVVDELYVQSQQVVGAVNGSQYMCMSNVRTVFLRNQMCAIPTLKVVAQSCQTASFPTNTSNSTADDFCRYNNMKYKCIYLGMKHSCNEETARMIVDFNVRSYAPPLAAGVNCSLVVPYAECVQSSLDRCSALSPAASPTNRSLDWTASDMNDFCSQSVTFGNCVNLTSCVQSVDPLYTTFQQLVGARNGFNYMCSSNSRQVFLQNQKCFNETLASSSLSCFNSTFGSELTTSAEVCRTYDTYFQCIYNKTRAVCTADASQVAVTYFVRIGEPPLNASHGCSFNVTSYWSPPPPVNSAPAVATASWLILAFTVLLATAGRWPLLRNVDDH
jgi:hypothetical protein